MKKLQIAVGIIRNPQGEIFITQRAADAHMANKLEFPGGKIESDETPEQALIRELQEEVGITVTTSSLFDKLEYQFPDRHITLWFFLVESWQGEPWGKEGQPGRWMAGPTLDPAAFPPANEPVIACHQIRVAARSSHRYRRDPPRWGCASLPQPILPDRSVGSACYRTDETDSARPTPQFCRRSGS